MDTKTTRRTLALGLAGCSAALLAVTACDREPKDRPSVTETRGASEPATPAAEPAEPRPTPVEPLTQRTEPAQPEPQKQAQPQGARPGAQPEGQGATPTNLPPFEGELKMNVAGKAPESLEYAMKGDKIRIGLSATPGKNDKGIDAIIDTDDKKALVLLNDRKEYVEVDLAKLATKAKKRVENVRMENTGETDTVSGRTCEKWKILDRDVQVNACVAKGAPYFDLTALEEQAGFKAPAWLHSVVDEGYVPLRVSIVDPKGGTKMAGAQVADMSSKVDDSRFEVPTGYTKTDPGKLGVPTPAK